MIIATRVLMARTKSGDDRSVTVWIYAPTLDGTVWNCRYEVDWPEDGWPAKTLKSHAQGGDSMQALQLAMQKIGVELHFTSYDKEGTLRWVDGWVGYGFAVDKSARDLLTGDDATYYGP